MSFCSKCGAYIPMDDTVCPACGFDPEQEQQEQEKQAREQQAREQEQARKAADAAQGSGGARQYQYQYNYGTQRTYDAGAARQQYDDRAAERQRQARAAQEPYNARTSGTSYDNTREPWDQARQTADPWETGRQRRDAWEEPGAVHQEPRWQEYQEGGASQQEQRRRAAASVDSQKLSVLSYFGPLFLVPFLLRKGDPFARFHANQGLLLFLAEILVNVAADAVPGFGWLVSLAGGVFALSCVVRGVRSVLQGRMDKLPVIGDITLIK